MGREDEKNHCHGHSNGEGYAWTSVRNSRIGKWHAAGYGAGVDNAVQYGDALQQRVGDVQQAADDQKEECVGRQHE